MDAEDRLRGSGASDDRALHRGGRAGGLLDLKPRRSFVLALLVAGILGVAGIFQHELWTPDEPREAEIGREMLLAGFSPLPTLGGEPFVEKPPLFPWAIAASYAVFGVSAGAARIPAALFGIGAVLVAWALGKRAGGSAAGLASAVVLATTAKFAEVSHASINDAALLLFVGAGHLAIFCARDGTRPRTAYAIAGLCAGLAFLTKAWIGPILLAGPPLAAAAVAREWDFLRRAILPLSVCVVAGVVLLGLPWVLVLASSHGWDPLRVCLVENLVGRAVGDSFGHGRGPLYYLGAVPLAFLPWTLALPAAIRSRPIEPGVRFLAWTALAGVLLLSIPSGKRDLYALPLFPAASVLPGVWIARAGATKLAGAAVLLALVFHAVLRPWIDRYKNLGPGAIAIARTVPGTEPILAYAPDETTRAVVPFYTGRLLVATTTPETAGHLVVIDSAEKKLPVEARRGLIRIAEIELGATRKANVYRR